MKIMKKDEFIEFMGKMREKDYPSKTAQMIHMLDLLWTSQKIVSLACTEEYMQIESKELEEILCQIFSPLYLNKCFRGAMNHELDVIQDHQNLVNLMTRSNASYNTIRDYFSRFQFYPQTIAEFRGVLFDEYELRQWVRDKARHPLKISDFELSRILEFNLKSLKCTGLKERLNALLDCISKFGDHKTITLKQMEDFLGCSSTQLDEHLEELFLKLEGGAEFHIYRSLIYDYRRSSFMDKFCLRP